MNEKERNFMAIFGLIVSIVIFVAIIFYTVDFREIKAKTLGDKMIKCLIDKRYEEFYENLDIASFTTIDKFKNYQENIDETMGDIKEYKYLGTYKNKNSSGENDVIMEYNVKFFEFPDEDVKIIFTYSNDKLKVSKYELSIEDTSKNSELTNILNILKSNIKEETKESIDAKLLINNVVQAYNDENYNYVYTILSNELKEKGNEEEFTNYLKNQHNKYGQIFNSKFKGYEISKDKTEYKLNYCIESNKSNKIIYIIFWVKIKDKPYLSGINFSENVW